MNYYDEIEKFRNRRDAESEFMQGLVDKLKFLEESLNSATAEKDKAEREKALVWREFASVETKLKDLHLSLDRRYYVLMLIDGDSLIFNDAFVQQAEVGGGEAGGLLLAHAQHYINSLQMHGNVDVSIRIYCNMRGLELLFQRREVIGSTDTFRRFVCGVNKSSPLIDFVDAGNGKECADEKIRQNFRAAIDNVQCRHIIFGGPTDNGYARLLGPVGNDPRSKGAITLLGGPPLAPEMQALQQKFGFVEFPEVFRSDKIEVPTHHIQNQNQNGAGKSYARIIGDMKSTSPVLRQSSPPTKLDGDDAPIPINSSGQRVDVAIPSVSEPLKYEVRGSKFCNSYHLLGQCRNYHCGYVHGERLTGNQKYALQWVARLSPCTNGTNCRESQCSYGHNCANKTPHSTSHCKFGDMHNIDQVIARYI